MSDPIDRLRESIADAAAYGTCAVLPLPELRWAADELTRLREENARMLSDQVAALRLVADIRAALCDNGKRMQAELIAYCKALRADAERYQWLRKHHVRGPYITDIDGCAISGDDADEDVDAARAGGVNCAMILTEPPLSPWPSTDAAPARE